MGQSVLRDWRTPRRTTTRTRTSTTRTTNPLNLNISVSGGNETNQDSPSSGERRGTSPAPNRFPGVGMGAWVLLIVCTSGFQVSYVLPGSRVICYYAMFRTGGVESLGRWHEMTWNDMRWHVYLLSYKARENHSKLLSGLIRRYEVTTPCNVNIKHVNKMEHQQDEQSYCESDDDTVHVLLHLHLGHLSKATYNCWTVDLLLIWTVDLLWTVIQSDKIL